MQLSSKRIIEPKGGKAVKVQSCGATQINPSHVYVAVFKIKRSRRKYYKKAFQVLSPKVHRKQAQ